MKEPIMTSKTEPMLTRMTLYHYVDGKLMDGAPKALWGDVTDLSGDATGLYGKVTNLRGYLDDLSHSCGPGDKDHLHRITRVSLQ